MTEEQIEKLAGYIVFLRNRVDAHCEVGDKDMMDYYYTKIEAAREIAIVFDCRDEVFKKVYELED